MHGFQLGELRLILSYDSPSAEEADPCEEEPEEEGVVEATEYFQEPLAIGSPSSEQRRAYARACKRRKRLGAGMNNLLLRRSNGSNLETGGAVWNGYQADTPSTTSPP